MSDIVERLRKYKSWDNPVSAEEAAAEIERLRAALKSCPCPGGGWNGMPKDLDPTVEACVVNKVCGCELGRTLEGK